jgi:hypothetical protein
MISTVFTVFILTTVFVSNMMISSPLQRRRPKTLIAILTIYSLHFVLLLNRTLPRDKTSKVILCLALSMSGKELVDILHFFHLVILVRLFLCDPCLLLRLRTQQCGAVHGTEK